MFTKQGNWFPNSRLEEKSKAVKTMSLSRERLQFIPQLDSFRFFAVFLVIISHWLPSSKLNIMPTGRIGVTFFFVLSGFLISSNLLYTKHSLDEGKLTLKGALTEFYLRRTLRIFPLYYFAIIALLVTIPKLFEDNLEWYLLYVPNFLFFKEQKWPGMLSHLWSLGVEEQFYILWPLIILLVRKSVLKFVIISVILFSVGFKIFANSFFSFYDVLPFSCFDSFGIGALLAYSYVEEGFVKNKILNIPLGINLILFSVVALLIFVSGLSFLFGFFVSLIAFLIIRQAINGYQGVAGMILDYPVLRYLGRISYGLYVYHNFIPWLVRCFRGKEKAYPILSIPEIKSDLLNKPILLFITELFLLVIIASLSWFLLEKPFIRLKRFIK
jgi:peptidoglycan/LPS O-acetylase OafA/YrhL